MPDGHSRNFRASRSGDCQFFFYSSAADFEALKLWKGQSGDFWYLFCFVSLSAYLLLHVSAKLQNEPKVPNLISAGAKDSKYASENIKKMCWMEI